MIDFSPCDSAPGEPPKRALMPQERVLHVHLWTNEEPQTGLCTALRSIAPASAYERVDWPKHNRFRPLPWGPKPEQWSELDDEILGIANQLRPTLVFMQLQTAGVVDAALLRVLRKECDPSAVFVSWCGDVGRDPAWAHAIAPHMDAMLYSSMTQVEQHRAAGYLNAAYLQIGYDTDIHHAPYDAPRSGIVFLGQNYTDKAWSQWMPDHEAKLRRDAVMALREQPHVDFTVCGQGWDGHWGGVRTLNRADSAHLYRTARGAVSVSLTSKYKRYSSDRLLRALACGPIVLVKRFEEMSSWGLEHGKNCLIWHDVSQLAYLAYEVGLGSYYPRDIGEAGARLAREHHTWDVRMQELAVYVDYIRRSRP